MSLFASVREMYAQEKQYKTLANWGFFEASSSQKHTRGILSLSENTTQFLVHYISRLCCGTKLYELSVYVYMVIEVLK